MVPIAIRFGFGSAVEIPRWDGSSPEERVALEKAITYAQDLGAEVVRRRGANVAEAIAAVAREENAATIVVGHVKRGRWRRLLNDSVVNHLLDIAGEVDVHVVHLDQR